MFDRFFGRKAEPLTGGPRVPRLKAYTAQSGFVYHYYYLGHRDWRSGGDHGSEYVFDVSSDRKTFRHLSVSTSERALASWEARHGRGLIAAERYAIAKMALFQAFDERPEAALPATAVLVRPADVDAILETLGIE